MGLHVTQMHIMLLTRASQLNDIEVVQGYPILSRCVYRTVVVIMSFLLYYLLSIAKFIVEVAQTNSLCRVGIYRNVSEFSSYTTYADYHKKNEKSRKILCGSLMLVNNVPANISARSCIVVEILEVQNGSFGG